MSTLPIVTRIDGASVRIGVGPECSPCAGRAASAIDVLSAERGEDVSGSAKRAAIAGAGALEGFAGGCFAAAKGSTGRDGVNAGDGIDATAAGAGLAADPGYEFDGSAIADGRFSSDSPPKKRHLFVNRS